MLDYFFVRKDLNVHTIDDLNGKIVAIPKGYAHAIIIQKEFPRIKILWVDTFSEAIDAVLEYKADMLFDTYTSITYSLKTLAVNTIIPFKAYRGKGVMKIHMSVNEYKPILANIIDKALKDINKSQINSIYQKWFGDTYISTEFTRKEKEWISKHPVVKIAIDKGWRPFEFIDKNGDYSGLSHDYIQLISQKSGLHFEIIPINKWTDILQAIKEKKIDMLTAISYSKERESFIDFTKPYLTYSLALVTHKSNKFFYTLDDFSHKTIGVVDGYLTQKLLKKHYPNIKQKSYTNVQSLLQGLNKHEVDAIFDNSVTLAYYIIDGGYTYFTMNAIGDMPKQKVSMGIAKGNDILLSIINKTLNKITDKQRKEIYDNWVSFDFAKIVDYTFIYKIILLFILILLFIIYKNTKLNHTKKELKTLINNIPLHIIVTDLQWNILDANLMALDSLDCSLKRLKKQDASIFYKDPTLKQKLQNILEEKNIVERHIITYKYHQNQFQNMMLSIIPIQVYSKHYLVHIAIDLTQRLQLEKNLKYAKEEALKANEIKGRFLANVSHEIRTPINSINGFSSILQKELTDQRLNKYATSINSAGQRLLSLVNEILDASKIEANKIEIHKQDSDLYKILQEIEDLFSLKISQKNILFTINIQDNLPHIIHIDELKVYQILLNLTGNAVKFTQKGFITLDVSYNTNDDNTINLQISITDSGIGIKKDQIDKIFEPFQQQDKQDNKKYEGTGLGLFISKKYAQMMNGDITMTSEEGQGTTFVLYLNKVKIIPQHIKQNDLSLQPHHQKIDNTKRIIKINNISTEDIKKLTEIYHHIKSTKSLDDIKQFIDYLENLSIKYHSQTLNDITQDIKTAYESFDIYAIDELLSIIDNYIVNL